MDRKIKEEDRKFWEKFMDSVNTEAFRECPECGHTLNEPPSKLNTVVERVWIKNQGCCPPIIFHCHNCDNFYAVMLNEDEQSPELSKLILEIDLKKLKKLKKIGDRNGYK